MFFSKFYVHFGQRNSIMKKRCHIPDGVRAAICKMFQNGFKVSGITRNLPIWRSTVSSIVQQFKKTGESSKQKLHGQKPKLNNVTLRIVARIISASRKEPKQKILNEVKMSVRTFEQYFKKIGFRRRVLGKKQVLGRKHPLIGYHGTKHGDCWQWHHSWNV